MRHEPVLLREVMEGAVVRPGMHIVDCTAGDGGHSEAMLQAVHGNARLLLMDKDPESLARAKQFLYSFQSSLVPFRASFDEIESVLSKTGFASPDIILADLGWSSPQFAERGRGFSFQEIEEPLDMRFDPLGGVLTAAQVLNTFSEDELFRILREYGEERYALDIAEHVADHRRGKPFEKVGELVELVLSVYREKLHSTAEIPWIGGLHPATRTFQALRIAVNDELAVLERFIVSASKVLAPGGKLLIISFHSLEDRIIKHAFKDMDGNGFGIITKKPIVPSAEECAKNPRAASAKLRIIQKI